MRPEPRAGSGERRRKARLDRLIDRVAVVLFLAAIGFIVASLEDQAEESGYTAVDTRRARMDPPWGWVDSRWHDFLAHRLAEFGTIDANDPAAIQALADEIVALPFVEAVGTPRTLQYEGEWGVRVPVRLVDVVGCARVGRWFHPVSSEGRVLPGRWPSPPRAGAGFLPVIGPVEAAAPTLRPGDDLGGEAARSGLSIAASLWRHLDDASLSRLGRVVIDASLARVTSPSEPGARLLLESGREVLFGRSPDLDEPGELPVAAKWASLGGALDVLEREDFDWGVCDVRWDEPELSPRTGVAAREEAGTSRPSRMLGVPTERPTSRVR